MESLLVWTLAACATLALVYRTRRTSTVVAAVALVASIAVGQALFAARAGRSTTPKPAIEPLRDRGYVSSDSCRACHPAEYQSWHRSFHRTMTQDARASTVAAPFAGETLVADDGRRYRLRRDGEALWADVAGAGARRIELQTGSHHMQAYWLSGDRGNQQIEFPFTWLLDDQRWVPRRDVFLVGNDYSKTPSIWNRICIECHVTGGQPRLDERTGASDSRVAELGIACEACHGPAGPHVDANQSPFRRRMLEASGEPDPTIVNPQRLSPARASEVCGQCHGIGCPLDGWLEDGIRYRPGQRLAETKPILELASLGASACAREVAGDDSFAKTRYWRDGMVRISGREYNGLLESPCFRRGALSCLSCHSMHQSAPNRQLKRENEDNSDCTQCHIEYAKNPERHTHHPAGSTGSSCYNCHMPQTTYGLLRAMRSHQISIPRIADTTGAGRPNACNLCHLDRTLAWTAQALERWYGTPAPALDDEQRRVASSVLQLSRGEAGVRAILAYAMGWAPARAASGEAWMAPYLIELLDDDYSAIRYIAYHSLRQIKGFEDFEYDYIAPEDQRWAAQRQARERLAKRWSATENRPELLFDAEGRFERGELERLMAGRPEDDEMFLAE